LCDQQGCVSFFDALIDPDESSAGEDGFSWIKTGGLRRVCRELVEKSPQCPRNQHGCQQGMPPGLPQKSRTGDFENKNSQRIIALAVDSTA